MPAMEVRAARFSALSPDVLYGILRLRSEVFVVEQQCLFLDLDGRDAEPTAWHCWVQTDGRVTGCARVLREPQGSSVGRVVTHAAARRRGVGAALVDHALELAPRPTAINAQSPLAAWYGRFGFEACGDEFVEDGIPHLPMRLDAP